ncbi:NAD(P)H-dependent oxidoreductase, partial [Veillonella atypica]|uniref:flavodoxin family protein n=1 Tax=Veillonella atypica TaxID=39777 RepID=UPI0023B14EA8
MIKSCNDCHEVEICNYRKEPCQQNDDIKIVLKKMKEADCLIYATPVHGFGMPSLMQSFIDLVGVGYLRFERPLSKKIG